MSTINITNGYDYHIVKSQDGYEIFYNDKDKLFKLQINNGKVVSDKVVDYCQEKIPLIDGKFLKRVRELLTISEE
jgi:hypothetical protein